MVIFLFKKMLFDKANFTCRTSASITGSARGLLLRNWSSVWVCTVADSRSTTPTITDTTLRQTSRSLLDLTRVKLESGDTMKYYSQLKRPNSRYNNNNNDQSWQICVKLASESGWTIVHDPLYQAPYAYKGNQWIGYDDQNSLALKVYITWYSFKN